MGCHESKPPPPPRLKLPQPLTRPKPPAIPKAHNHPLSPPYFIVMRGPTDSIPEISRAFLSLLSFIQDERRFTTAIFNRAASLLTDICRKSQGTRYSRILLHDLVPTQDGTCQGFTDGIVSIILTNNIQLTQPALLLTLNIQKNTSMSLRFAFISSHFFEFLSIRFLQNPMHMLSQYRYHLMDLVWQCLLVANQSSIREITQDLAIDEDTVHKSTYDMTVGPQEPFFLFICANRDKLTDHQSSRPFPRLLGSLLHIAPFHRLTTYFVLTVPIMFSFTTSICTFENNSLVNQFIRNLAVGFAHNPVHLTGVRKSRRNLLLWQLKAEGIEDELDLFPNKKSIQYRTVQEAKKAIWR
ncbi:hypothetical protein BLNAU_21436 [Blattamonas nauphoetae]|uniref:Uncharacterized protein n=1 Tax=Blattamonas nauphoetae TaxID=2049346 RepID=A0ABQ9WZ06_9EUKA|nr:hypothetical protein BLNAU_21436 [Blattamonas nauphoetae]